MLSEVHWKTDLLFRKSFFGISMQDYEKMAKWLKQIGMQFYIKVKYSFSSKILEGDILWTTFLLRWLALWQRIINHQHDLNILTLDMLTWHTKKFDIRYIDTSLR